MKTKRIITITSLLCLIIIIVFASILLIVDNSRQYVYFDTDGGTSLSREVIDKDGRIKDVTIPSKDGYIFNGWFLDNNYTENIDLSTYVFSETTTVYCRYTTYFTSDFFNDFYTLYKTQLEKNIHKNNELYLYMEQLGKDKLTHDILVDVLVSELKKSEKSLYNVYTKTYLDYSQLDETQKLDLHEALYVSNGKTYYKSANQYVNVGDENDRVDVIADYEVYKVDQSYYYTPKDPKIKKVYVLYTNGEKTNYHNICDYSDTYPVQIMDEHELLGTFRLLNDELLINYNPVNDGYKKTPFLVYFDSHMEYLLFDKVFNTYYTKDYIRLMVEVVFRLIPDTCEYTDINIEKITNRVKNKYFNSFIDFNNYLFREDEISNKTEEVNI